jgi:hypothetical protein
METGGNGPQPNVLTAGSIRLYAHATALELDPQRRRQIVLVAVKILSNLILGFSHWFVEHRGKEAAPQ